MSSWSAVLLVALAVLAHGRLELHENPMNAWFYDTDTGSRGVPPVGIAVTSADEMIVCGFWGANPWHADTTTKAYVSKFGKDMKHVWTRFYAGSNRDFFSNCVLDENDNIYAVGYTQSHIVSAPNPRDVLLVSLDQDGNQRWARQYSEQQYRPVDADRSRAHSLAYRDGILVSSYRHESNYFMNVVTFNATQGDPIWLQTITTASYQVEHHYEWSNTISFDSNGDIYVAADFLGNFGPTDASWQVPDAGHTNSQAGSYWEVVLFKLAADGTKLWRRFIAETGHQLVTALATDPDDNVYLCGRTDTSLYGEIQGINEDAFLLKYAGDGTRVGARLWDTLGDDEFCTALAIDEHGAIYAGTYLVNNDIRYKYYATLSRFDTELNRLQTIQFPQQGVTLAQALTVQAIAVRNSVVHVAGTFDDTFDVFVSPYGSNYMRHGFIRRYRDNRNCNCTDYDELVQSAASLLNIQVAS